MDAHLPLKVWTNGGHWLIAHSAADAVALMQEHGAAEAGYPDDEDPNAFTQVPDDEILDFEDGGIDNGDDQTAAHYVETFGRMYLAKLGDP